MVIEPAPIDNTQSNFPQSLSKCKTVNNGWIIDAAVIIATVDEPCAVLRTEVTIKGKKIPTLPSKVACVKCSLSFVAVNTAPNAPPAPMMTKMLPAFSTLSVSSFPIISFLKCLIFIKASSTPIDKAITGSPNTVKIFVKTVRYIFN